MPDLYDLPLKDIPKKTSIELMGFSTKKICNDIERIFQLPPDSEDMKLRAEKVHGHLDALSQHKELNNALGTFRITHCIDHPLEQLLTLRFFMKEPTREDRNRIYSDLNAVRARIECNASGASELEEEYTFIKKMIATILIGGAREWTSPENSEELRQHLQGILGVSLPSVASRRELSSASSSVYALPSAPTSGLTGMRKIMEDTQRFMNRGNLSVP